MFSIEESDRQIGKARTNMVGRKLKPTVDKQTIRKHQAIQMSSSAQGQVNAILLRRGRCGVRSSCKSAGDSGGGVREQESVLIFKNRTWEH